MTVENIQNSIYARLADSSSFYLVCLDTSGCYTYVNPNFAQKLSFINADLIGLHHHEAIHPEDTTLTQGMIEACLAMPSEIFIVRVRIPNEQGIFGWSHWEISAYQNSEGAPEGIICAGYDISLKESLTREALWHAKKLDNIIEHITDGFLIIDRDWKLVKVNRVFEQIIEVKREHILGKCIWEVFPDSVKYQYPAAYRKAALENVATTFLDYNEESNRWYEGRVYPSTEGLTVIFRDITEKKLAEEKIWKSKSKLSAILDSTMDINMLLAPDYRIISFNRKAYESMRVYFENLCLAPGQNILDYILPGTETDFKKNFQAALHGKTVEVKIKLFFKPGLALWYQIKYMPVYDSNRNIIAVSFNSTNIDQQQRQYERLEEIASLYSHEIRRPVATILGLTQLINPHELSSENQEWFKYLRKTTLELDKVIHRIVKKTSDLN